MIPENYPRVTQIISILNDFSGIPSETLEYAAERGRLVHDLIHLDCLGQLDDINLCGELLPYYGAWQEFLATTGFQVLETELSVVHEGYKYRGTLDLIGMLDGKKILLDIKTRKFMPLPDPIQTAAYMGAYNQGRPAQDRIRSRRVLSLTTNSLTISGEPQGIFKLTPELKNPNDYRIFLACLAIHQYKRGA